MTTNLRPHLHTAITRDFLVQAFTIITADEEPRRDWAAPDPKYKVKDPLAPKRPAPIPSKKELDPESQEAKDFVGLTNYLHDVERDLKHSITMMLGYSTAFQKELRNTLKLFEAHKKTLQMGDLRQLSQLVDAVQKVHRAVDSVADRFESLDQSTKDLGDSVKPISPKDKEKMNLQPLEDLDKDIRKGETKTKLRDFFKDIKTKFGPRPQAATVMLARALVQAATEISK